MMRRIRYSSDSLNLPRLCKLHRSDGLADGTCEDNLTSSTGCHSPLHHLRARKDKDSSSLGFHFWIWMFKEPRHLKVKAFTLNAKLLHQRKNRRLQSINLQKGQTLKQRQRIRKCAPLLPWQHPSPKMCLWTHMCQYREMCSSTADVCRLTQVSMNGLSIACNIFF